MPGQSSTNPAIKQIQTTTGTQPQQNRVSKQNLREAAGSGGNLKDYGMSIITGGK